MSLVMLKALTWDLIACALLCQLRGSSLSGRRCRRGIDSATSVLPLSEANQLPSWSKTLPSGSVHLGTLGIRGGELSTMLLPCWFGRWSCYFRSDDSATAVCVGACRVNTECLNSTANIEPRPGRHLRLDISVVDKIGAMRQKRAVQQ
jgi:hypothetical protein